MGDFQPEPERKGVKDEIMRPEGPPELEVEAQRAPTLQEDKQEHLR